MGGGQGRGRNVQVAPRLRQGHCLGDAVGSTSFGPKQAEFSPGTVRPLGSAAGSGQEPSDGPRCLMRVFWFQQSGANLQFAIIWQQKPAVSGRSAPGVSPVSGACMRPGLGEQLGAGWAAATGRGGGSGGNGKGCGGGDGGAGRGGQGWGQVGEGPALSPAAQLVVSATHLSSFAFVCIFERPLLKILLECRFVWKC